MIQPQAKEAAYNVRWHGPFDIDELTDDVVREYEYCVVYILCATHGLYGRNFPIYIEKTERDAKRRLAEQRWIADEPDPIKVYFAAIGEMIRWERLPAEFPPPNSDVIENIEGLLGFSIMHQPAYNNRTTQKLRNDFPMLRILNTGRRSTLYSEISTLLFRDNDTAYRFVVG